MDAAGQLLPAGTLGACNRIIIKVLDAKNVCCECGVIDFVSRDSAH